MNQPNVKVVMINANSPDPNVRMDMEVRMIADAGYDVSVLGWDRSGSHPKVERKGNHTVYKIKIKAPTKGGRKIVFFWPLWWFAEFTWLMRQKWDIVHVADLDAFIPALLAAKLKRKAIIYDIYDVYADSVPLPRIIRWIVLIIEKYTAKLAKVIIMTSEGHRHRLGLDSDNKVNMIYNVCQYVPNETRQPRTSKFRVFYAGNLFRASRNNIDKMILAVKGIPDVELTIIGYGDSYEDELKALARQEKIDNVQFLGRRPRVDVLQETINADLLFCIYDPELPINAISLPHKLFDAITYNKPILVPQNTLLAEFVRKYDCGIPVECRSPEDIKAAIIKIKDDTAFYNRLVEGGKKAYEQEYNWQAMSKRVLDIYSGLLTRR